MKPQGQGDYDGKMKETLDAIMESSYRRISAILFDTASQRCANPLQNPLHDNKKHKKVNLFLMTRILRLHRKEVLCKHLKWMSSVKLNNPYNDNVQKIVRMTEMFANPVYRSL